MKNIFFSLWLFCLAICACNQNPAPPSAAPANALQTASFADTTAEKAAVLSATRAFFSWYGAFATSPQQSAAFDFIDTTGPHLKLNMKALDQYLDLFIKGGYTGHDFLQFEKAFYQKCEKAWQKEEKDDIPSGMDADHIECTQEDLADFFQKSPGKVVFTGPDKATVSFVMEGDTPANALKVFMKKENGKWLYIGTDCEMGL
jgi:hypothetical protein